VPRFDNVRSVPFSADEMFALVADVERYPEFVPLCESLVVHTREQREDGTGFVTATMGIGYKAIREKFTTNVTLDPLGRSIVVRHKSAGVPWQIARWIDASVINAGDGWHEHPTQALLDCYTIRHHLGSLAGKHIAIVGDIKHSRVARSDVKAFAALGAEITFVAPQTLLPPSLEGWPVKVSHDLDAVLPTVDVCYLLRMQRERMTEALVPSLREYHTYYGLDGVRADRMPKGSIIMHPGPMNRGVEITAEVAGRDNSVIIEQVANGVAVRMAVLFLLLGSGVDVIGGHS